MLQTESGYPHSFENDHGNSSADIKDYLAKPTLDEFQIHEKQANEIKRLKAQLRDCKEAFKSMKKQNEERF